MGKLTFDLTEVATYTQVVAELVRQGVTFEARSDGYYFVITLTGGY
jgi:hypothetical protein